MQEVEVTCPVPFMKRTALLFLSVAVIVLAAFTPSHADFYAYTDSSGKMHVTNTPKTPGYRMIMRETVVRARWEGRGPERARLDRIIRKKARKYGVDPALVAALIKAESDFDLGARSGRGARGLMQLMPATAREMGVSDVTDPEENIDGGVRYLSHLLRLFGRDTGLAVAAYNAGEEAVKRYGAVPPFEETRKYVRKVLRYYNDFRGK